MLNNRKVVLIQRLIFVSPVTPSSVKKLRSFLETAGRHVRLACYNACASNFSSQKLRERPVLTWNNKRFTSLLELNISLHVILSISVNHDVTWLLLKCLSFFCLLGMRPLRTTWRGNVRKPKWKWSDATTPFEPFPKISKTANPWSRHWSNAGWQRKELPGFHPQRRQPQSWSTPAWAWQTFTRRYVKMYAKILLIVWFGARCTRN